MQGGDLAKWGEEGRTLVVLESVLVAIRYEEPGLLLSWARKSPVPKPPEDWAWSDLAIKSLLKWQSNENLHVEVVTFESQAIAEAAADFLNRVDVPVAQVVHQDFKTFTRSLPWRSDVLRVIDTVPDRLALYGQIGYQVVPGREF